MKRVSFFLALVMAFLLILTPVVGCGQKANAPTASSTATTTNEPTNQSTPPTTTESPPETTTPSTTTTTTAPPQDNATHHDHTGFFCADCLVRNGRAGNFDG
ncbi:MAG: hypothetical protein Q7T57_01065 [Dehalococcoidales bacterium]|nr:hypothetical protein [Dehalococcoidales bacterium]